MLRPIITFTIVLLAASAIGFLFFPAQMLAVVGIESDPQMEFLLRTTGVGVICLIPGAWAGRAAPASPVSRAVFMGLTGYMLLSSVIDFYAYTQAIVNWASLPSIAFRVCLGGVIVWLTIKETKIRRA